MPWKRQGPSSCGQPCIGDCFLFVHRGSSYVQTCPTKTDWFPKLLHWGGLREQNTGSSEHRHFLQNFLASLGLNVISAANLQWCRDEDFPGGTVTTFTIKGLLVLDILCLVVFTNYPPPIYIYTYIHIYISTYLHIYIYTYIYIHIHTYIYICTYQLIYILHM